MNKKLAELLLVINGTQIRTHIYDDERVVSEDPLRIELGIYIKDGFESIVTGLFICQKGWQDYPTEENVFNSYLFGTHDTEIKNLELKVLQYDGRGLGLEASVEYDRFDRIDISGMYILDEDAGRQAC